MRIALVSLVVLPSLGLAGVVGGAQAAPAERWAAIAAPSPGQTRVIGSAAAGCIAGAVSLGLDGAGYQVLRPQRNRVWAHPDTIAFIQTLGAKAKRDRIGTILVGDMSQPRGGPMSFGHGSHQTGLDADIWFRLPAKPLSEAELADPRPISMVKGRKVDSRTWTQSHMNLLRLAASAPEIDRIFVNPAIKAEACRKAKGDRAWLAKLRPWWGHDEHFHVRLACPAGQSECTPQAAVPDGDGCGAELTSWLRRNTILPKETTDKPNRRRPVLPESCQAVLDQPAKLPAAFR
jgi:penicillin-insensitive murein endopeptidase